MIPNIEQFNILFPFYLSLYLYFHLTRGVAVSANISNNQIASQKPIHI